ncbi:NUDIX hydrolase [Enterococcus sp. LJL90]
MSLFHRQHRKIILENPWYNLYLDAITQERTGQKLNYYVIDVPNESVAGIILNPRQEILFVAVPRYLLDTLSWEIPAGSLEAAETPETALARECLEETGYQVTITEKLYEYYPSNSITNQKFAIYLGYLQEELPQKVFDQNEVQQVEWLTLTKVRELIQQNTITDGLTLTALLLYLQYLTE